MNRSVRTPSTTAVSRSVSPVVVLIPASEGHPRVVGPPAGGRCAPMLAPRRPAATPTPAADAVRHSQRSGSRLFNIHCTGYGFDRRADVHRRIRLRWRQRTTDGIRFGARGSRCVLTAQGGCRMTIHHDPDAAPLGFPESSDKGLKSGALGLVSSIVVGMASTAPAYSLAASLGFVVATSNGDDIVGVKAPAIMLLAFVPMFL